VSIRPDQSLSALGGGADLRGTISHRRRACLRLDGEFSNTMALAGITRHGNRDVIWHAGNGSGAAAFFYAAAAWLSLLDSYDSDGPRYRTRCYCGPDQGQDHVVLSVASDNPAGHYCGFFR